MSQSLAALEMLVHTADPNDLVELDYVAISVELDERMINAAAKFPRDWRSYPAPHSTMKIGDRWALAKPLLALPLFHRKRVLIRIFRTFRSNLL